MRSNCGRSGLAAYVGNAPKSTRRKRSASSGTPWYSGSSSK